MEGKRYAAGEKLDHTAAAAVTGGQVIQTAEGWAAVLPVDLASGELGAAEIEGIYKLPKTADVALLKGGDAWWDVSASKVHFKPGSGTPDFFLGTVVEDAAESDTEVLVRLNRQANYTIDLEKANPGDGWTTENTDGLGVTADTLSQIYTLSFDAVAEVAQAALFSKHKVTFGSKPILEGRIAVFNIGDNAALDINAGLASDSHATDFEAIAAFAAIQLDGNSLNINTHSDDGTTDRAPADSTIDAVDDTYFEFWIDCRDDTNVKFYIDGVLIDTSAAKRIVTAALTTGVHPIVHIEKTSDDTVADVRVTRLRVRTNGE